jgi:hypothetical protein
MSWRAAVRRAAVATDRLIKERRFRWVELKGITKSPENVSDKVSKNKNATGTFRSGSHRDLSENSGDVAVRPDSEPSDGNQLWLLHSPLHGVCQLSEQKIIVLFQGIREIHGNACGLRGQISSRKQLKHCAVHKSA